MAITMKNSKRYHRGISLVSKIYILLITSISALMIYFYDTHTFGSEYTTAGVFTYPDNYAPSCTGKKSVIANHHQQKNIQGIRFNVTTPANYRNDYAHPLLVVWAPSGMSENMSERFTGLTREATEQGYIVVHTRSVPLGFKSLKNLSAIPSEVIESWCVDPMLVFYTGHSDGGTVSNALSVMPDSAFRPKALAPSAMGMQAADMQVYVCPEPTSVMLMHNKGDGHFPDYGRGVVQWWADCNQCSEQTVTSKLAGCVEYTQCAEGVKTLFCQAKGNHAHWPGPEHDPIRFFSNIVDATRGSLLLNNNVNK